MLALIFLFWGFFAPTSVALFLGSSQLGHLSLDAFLLTADGNLFMAFQFAIGAAVAFLTFGLTTAALPVLGHATWHMYRRALYHPL